MEQHPVPQDIKSFQFRLVGDMTIRQFAFLAGGAVIAYFFFVLPIPTYVKYPLVVLFAGGGAATAFVPINERPLDRWLIAFFKAIFGTTRRVWIKSAEPPELFTKSYALLTNQPLPTTSAEDRQKLENYLASLPPRPEEAVDQNEREKLEKIDFTIGETPSPVSQQAVPKTASDSRPTLAPQTSPPTKVLQVRSLTGEEKRLPQLTGVRIRKLGSNTHHGEIRLTPSTPGSRTPASAPVKPGQKQAPPPSTTALLPKTPSLPVGSKPSDQTQFPPASPPKPVSPKQTSQPPQLSGEPSELFSSEKEAVKKAEAVIAQQEEIETFEAKVKRLEAEKKILEEKAKEAYQRAEQFRKEVTQKQAASVPTPSPPTETLSQEPKDQVPAVPALPPQPLKKLVLPTITDTPNVINGVVADREGNLLENAIIVVKDSDNTPVRALKTNSLGQFAISTPLRNGNYSIEVEKEGHTFKPIYQEVAGTILPPLEIRARE